eukprot:3180632-Amphidinium_carterae.2
MALFAQGNGVCYLRFFVLGVDDDDNMMNMVVMMMMQGFGACGVARRGFVLRACAELFANSTPFKGAAIEGWSACELSSCYAQASYP